VEWIQELLKSLGLTGGAWEKALAVIAFALYLGRLSVKDMTQPRT
jgi:hypothetical protein